MWKEEQRIKNMDTLEINRDKGMSEIVEHNFGLAEEARKYIRSNKDYTLHSFENSLSICFNYKDYDPRDLCTKLYKHSKIMVGFGQFQNVFFH